MYYCNNITICLNWYKKYLKLESSSLQGNITNGQEEYRGILWESAYPLQPSTILQQSQNFISLKIRNTTPTALHNPPNPSKISPASRAIIAQLYARYSVDSSGFACAIKARKQRFRRIPANRRLARGGIRKKR